MKKILTKLFIITFIFSTTFKINAVWLGKCKDAPNKILKRECFEQEMKSIKNKLNNENTRKLNLARSIDEYKTQSDVKQDMSKIDTEIDNMADQIRDLKKQRPQTNAIKNKIEDTLETRDNLKNLHKSLHSLYEDMAKTKN
ncbi:MAG: hypothetical protein UR26_C0003G0110 [candidate division TM6 bacterium GW2011_GWF2_32_72]|nr:MAG: hypothetical protein UR26_C0003G0110 [candidate division TM6 bacterium GW2011_GWF2_32_72]